MHSSWSLVFPNNLRQANGQIVPTCTSRQVSKLFSKRQTDTASEISTLSKFSCARFTPALWPICNRLCAPSLLLNPLYIPGDRILSYARTKCQFRLGQMQIRLRPTHFRRAMGLLRSEIHERIGRIVFTAVEWYPQKAWKMPLKALQQHLITITRMKTSLATCLTSRLFGMNFSAYAEWLYLSLWLVQCRYGRYAEFPFLYTYCHPSIRLGLKWWWLQSTLSVSLPLSLCVWACVCVRVCVCDESVC
jgi:hypothetical protein